jgi:hypothetical protein
LLVGLTAGLSLAQSGDVSGSLSNVTTLGSTILKIVVALAGLGFVGLAFALVSTLTGNAVDGLNRLLENRRRDHLADLDVFGDDLVGHIPGAATEVPSRPHVRPQ